FLLLVRQRTFFHQRRDTGIVPFQAPDFGLRRLDLVSPGPPPRLQFGLAAGRLPQLQGKGNRVHHGQQLPGAHGLAFLLIHARQASLYQRGYLEGLRLDDGGSDKIRINPASASRQPGQSRRHEESGTGIPPGAVPETPRHPFIHIRTPIPFPRRDSIAEPRGAAWSWPVPSSFPPAPRRSALPAIRFRWPTRPGTAYANPPPLPGPHPAKLWPHRIAPSSGSIADGLCACLCSIRFRACAFSPPWSAPALPIAGVGSECGRRPSGSISIAAPPAPRA